MRGRDALLLHVGEAGQGQQFEALVQQRRDARGVGRDGDEQHAGEVQRQGDVAVAEAVVARGVEGAEQRLGRRLPNPVEFAENHQRVVGSLAGQGAELPQGVDEAPRPRVWSGSGDAENRRRLLGPGQRDASEAAAERRGQRPGESGPAGPGRARRDTEP